MTDASTPQSGLTVTEGRTNPAAVAARFPWAVRWRLWLGRFVGARLEILHQYDPRPLRLPAHYASTPCPNDPPLVSIVTPSFNQGVFLERTLRSVLGQNYPRLEYVVQDGGSTDESVPILRRYQDRLTRWESATDPGQAAAINRGFRHTTGAIMAYLNSDDLLLPGALAYVARYFAEHPEVDALYSHRVMIDEEDNEVGRWLLPAHDDEMLSWIDFVPQETLFWRRRIWERIGGAIDESFQFTMDWDMLVRFRDAGARIVRVPRFLGGFRVHPLQKTQALCLVGQKESWQLRQRVHGRPVTPREVIKHMGGYVARHVLLDRLYRLGLLRH